ncbi:MAG: CoA transferase [Actinomycetia bacterium]|nr:CoA transferase [Actinomycetes bacterium]
MTVAADQPAPLAGLRVVDLGQVLASPFGAYLLGLLGADVIKVEPPGGDWLRRGGSLGFATQNGDKRSVVVDLKQEGAADIVLRLVEGADVFLEGFAPGTAEAMGLGWEAVRARNPKIVYASLSAFGDAGPFAGRPGFDHVVQATTGIMTSTGFPDSPPTKVGSPYLDYGGGLLLGFATLAALLEQRRTGDAVQVDVTMIDAGLLFNAGGLVRSANLGMELPRTGNAAFSGAVASGAFETADGLLMVAANKVSHFVRLCDLLGLDDLADRTELAAPGADPGEVETARARMAEALLTASASEWEDRLAAAGIPGARVRSMLETIADGHPAGRGLLTEIDLDGEKTLVPTAGIRLNGIMPGPTGPPPSVGQHTTEVLLAAGYTESDLTDLESRDLIHR